MLLRISLDERYRLAHHASSSRFRRENINHINKKCRATVHATIAERSYAEREASTASSAEVKLACNPRTHAISARTGAAKNRSALWHGL